MIPSKLSCIQQVFELLHVVIPLSDSPFSSDNQSYITKVKNDNPLIKKESEGMDIKNYKQAMKIFNTLL